jgi:predicted secreted protein
VPRIDTFVTKATRAIALILPLLCFLDRPQPLAAQAILIPGSTAVGSSTAPVQVSVTSKNGGTINSVQVLGDGIQNIDFVNNGGSCAPGANILPGNTCSLSIIFKPGSPGPRTGEIVLLDSSNNVLGSQLLAGSATGSVGVFVPGIINTVAGDTVWVYGGDGHPATASSIFLPSGVAVDAAGNIYIADSNNNRIRKVNGATGIISTIAGNGTVGSAGDGGLAVNASLNTPSSVVLDPAGDVFFSDFGNNVVRRIDAFSGMITTVAGVIGTHGYSGDKGLASVATLDGPNGVSFDANGNLYITDTGNNVIRFVSAQTGVITTVAGIGQPGFGGDNGPATEATLNAPFSATPAPGGGFYIADQTNARIRFVNSAGVISTICGNGTANYLGDGGPASQAELNAPSSVLVDVAGNLYIADSGNNRVRRIDSVTGVINTYAGVSGESFTGDGGPANQAGLYGPYAFALDTRGDLYIADYFHNRIREVSATYAILQYPVMRVNRVSAPLTQTLENDGNAPLDITQLNPVSNGQIDPGTTTCSASAPLLPVAQCIIGVDFAPTSTGALVTGEVDVDSNAGNSPGVISLTGQVLDVDPTTTTVTSGLNPSNTGQPVTFTVNVTSTGSTPTGTITLLDGTTAIGTGTLGSGGIVTFTISNLTSGNHSITASYGGDSQNASSVSTVLTQVVKETDAATATVLTSATNPAIAGASVLFTANVNIVTPNSGNGAITGSVAFKQGVNTLGTATINNASASASNGVATISLSNLAVGTDSIVAVYAGNGSYAGSTSAALTETVVLATSKISVSSATNPSYAGAPLILSATLTSNGGIPTGNVQFLDGATNLGTAPINAQGVASLSVAGKFWTVGTHTLTAVYGGDADNAGSNSTPISEIINIAPTNVSVVSSLNPAGLGASVTFTASVSSSGGTPTGTVQFFDGTTSLGTGNLTATGSTAATTTFATPSLTLGNHSITAVYSGDSFDATSTSAPINQTIQSATIAVTLQTSAPTVVFGSPLTLTAQVTGSGSTPTGTVALLDGATTVATLPVPANGIVTFSNPTLAIGQHTLTASYSGDANHAAVTSAAISETVQQATTTALTTSGTSVVAGKSVTLTAVVTGVSGKPFTGNVNFTDGGALLATVAPGSNGSAAFTTANLIPGTHVIVASYVGDTLDAASASTSITVVVTIASTSTTLSTSANPINSGATLTLTSNVSGNGGTPTGTVSFLDGATVLTKVQLTSSGTATFSLSTLAPGIHQLTAAYSGDSLDGSSLSPVTAEQVVQKTTVTVASSENPSLLQDNVTLTVTVSNGSTSATPTGSVTLTDGSTVLATVNLSATGTATYIMQSPAVGTHSIVAAYAGDNQNSPASSQPLLQVVNLRPTTVTFTSSSTAVSSGQQITLISVVQGTGSTPPTGTVTWVSGSTILGSAPINSVGLATITITPPQGTFATVAQYSGDTLYAPSVSPTLTIVVGPTIEFTISLSPSSVSMASGDHQSMTINIASAASFADSLAIGCAGLPVDATCTFSTNQIALSGGSAKSLTVEVDTGNPLGAGASARLKSSTLSNSYECALPAGILLALLVGCNRRRLRKINPKLALFGLILLLGVGSSILTGCGSSFDQHHTPAGSYTFQIVATGNTTGATSTALAKLTVTQ